MLRSMRDGAKSGVLKFFLMGLLVLAAGGLVLTDVGGFFRGGVSATDVAKGKGFKIGYQQFDIVVRRTLAQQGISPQQAYQFGLIDQILNREIQARMISNEAIEYGLRIGDDTLVKQIAELTAPIASEGQSKKDALQSVLRQQGISETEFISSIRADLRNTVFRNALTGGTGTISDETAKDLYQFENETRDIQYFTLTNASVKGIEVPTDMQLETYYGTMKNQFLIPERRSITIATLKTEMLEDQIEITEDDLKEIYEDNIAQYEKEEQRTVHQSILNNADDAQKVADQVKSGKSLEKATLSVTGKKDGYLGENNFSKNGLLDEVAEPVFTATTNDVVGPIETALGFHVIQLKKIVPARVEPFDSVKKSIRNELLQERLIDEMSDTANTIDDRLASGEALEEIVSDIGLTTEKIADFSMGGTNKKDKDLFKSYDSNKSEILEASFEYEQGETSPVMELADGRYITIRVDAITERAYKPFKDVKAAVKKQWLATQRDAANRLRVSDAMNKLKGETSFADVAKELGVTVRTKKKLNRYDEVKEPLTANALRRLFSADLDTAISEGNKDGHIIAQATALNMPDPAKASKDDLEKVRAQNQGALGQDILTQYVNTLSKKYKVRINKRLLDQMYGTAPASGN